MSKNQIFPVGNQKILRSEGSSLSSIPSRPSPSPQMPIPIMRNQSILPLHLPLTTSQSAPISLPFYPNPFYKEYKLTSSPQSPTQPSSTNSQKPKTTPHTQAASPNKPSVHAKTARGIAPVQRFLWGCRASARV
jgi:hypothetical protein